ncbi:hypermethylated in cancer 1 protein-like isoform X3 [Lethenteron reissneri]|nr:hypermethylated in cancer 1 protein-like isoform X3 [Lethenteron reissneri]XP_061406365.1 hypermethylated in cancer 1 protein-like isoform X3 [Lethenteron reissneri]XP_061406366.1 hypermethylated in cancer 1 protein-like isoform X3 [Lethenteron reissneri]
MASRAGVLRLEMCGGSGALLAAMNSLRAEGKLCDVTVRLGAAAFPAHRVVLAAGSPYLRDQFLLNPSAGELRVSPLPEPRAALALLLSCYTGHLDVPAAQLVAYLTAASYLQMDHVVERCTKALSEYFQPRFGLYGADGADGAAMDDDAGFCSKAAAASPLSERSYDGESDRMPDGAGISEPEYDRCGVAVADGAADGATDGATDDDDENKAFDGARFGAERERSTERAAPPAGRKQQECPPRSLSIVKVEQLSGDEFDGDAHARRPQVALPHQYHHHRRQLEAARHQLSPPSEQNAFAVNLPADPTRHGHFECRRQRMVPAGSPDGATIITGTGVSDGEQQQEETNAQPYFQMPGHSPVYSSGLHHQHQHHHHHDGTRAGTGSTGCVGLRAGRGAGRFGIVPPSKAKSGRGSARGFSFRSAPGGAAVLTAPPAASGHHPHGDPALAVYSVAHSAFAAGVSPNGAAGGVGAKHFECSRCPKTFSHAEVLWAHMRTHKVFTCPRCGRQFSQSSNLTRHLRIHTGVKPFACALCGRCFTQKSSLHDHMNLHSGDRPHRCAHCQVGFAHKPALRRHLREQHQRGAAPAAGDGGVGRFADAMAADGHGGRGGDGEDGGDEEVGEGHGGRAYELAGGHCARRRRRGRVRARARGGRTPGQRFAWARGRGRQWTLLVGGRAVWRRGWTVDEGGRAPGTIACRPSGNVRDQSQRTYTALQDNGKMDIASQRDVVL